MQVTKRSIKIGVNGDALTGDLTMPISATGIVLFAHGSGSSRLSPRNQFVAKHLNEGGFATLLLDLLSQQEETVDQYTRHLRFEIGLLAARVELAVDWLKCTGETQALPIGLFGASTGSAAAIIAAADNDQDIRAVVSRGGRPDLAGGYLPKLRAPTLLIVGEEDSAVIELNKEAMSKMPCEKQLRIVPGATHLFEELGTLEQVADLANKWFIQYLAQPPLPGLSQYALR